MTKKAESQTKKKLYQRLYKANLSKTMVTVLLPSSGVERRRRRKAVRSQPLKEKNKRMSRFALVQVKTTFYNFFIALAVALLKF